MNQIYNEDCITGASVHFPDNYVDLMVCDPPFGINESSFDKHYKRQEYDIVLNGYEEAPVNSKEYYEFTLGWVSEAKRMLKDNGAFYIISGWSHLKEILNVVDDLGLVVINHIIWKYNFGVYTKKKYVSAHYHILYIVKNKYSKPTFNTYCRFGPAEKDALGGSLNYKDLEDVWTINKEYYKGKTKNKNKLPKELIDKIILYSSNVGDVVCDFFMGNFTTAYSAIRLGRTPVGFELNKNAYDYHIERLNDYSIGEDLLLLKRVQVNLPKNSGKSISKEEKFNIATDYKSMLDSKFNKKETIKFLMDKYGRGKFSIINILEDIDV